MRTFVIIISIIILNGCQSSERRIVKLLTNNSYKYWDLKYEINAKKRKFEYNPFCQSIRLSKNGKFFEYTISKNQRYNVQDGSDVIRPQSWEYINDSTLSINNISTKIEAISVNQLILNDGEIKLIYVASKHQSDSLTKKRKKRIL